MRDVTPVLRSAAPHPHAAGAAAELVEPRPPRHDSHDLHDRVRRRARRAAVLAAFAALVVALGAAGCGGDPETRIAEARALQDAGDFSSSIETLRAVLAADPDNEEANYLLGVALVQTRQPSLAIWPLRKAADSEQYGLVSGLLLASTLLQTEGYEEAVTVADHLLEKHPDHLTALLIRVTANLNTGHDEQALADAEHMLEIDPDHFQAQVSRATALQKLGRLDEAEAAWQKLAEAGRSSGDPSTAVRSCLALAQFYQTTKPKKAEPAIRACIDEHPADPIALQVAGDFYDHRKRHAVATGLWERAVEEEPDNFDLRVGLAKRYANHGDIEKAEATLRETAELFDDARAWDRLAVFYQSRDELDQAREAIERALERNPAQSEPLLFRKADLLVGAGQLDEAESIAEGFEQPAYRDLVIARVREARGDTEGALEAAESGISRWPNNAAARYLAGQLAEELGMRDKALSHYREATRKDPGGTDAALSAAILQLGNGQFQDAAGLARRHMDNRPVQGPQAYLVAARADTALGNYDHARATLEKLAAQEEYRAQATAELATVERRASGPEAALQAIDASGLDLADPANEIALRAAVDELVALGRTDEALARLVAAETQQGSGADLLDMRGRVLFAAGRSDEARAAFERALAIDADHAGANEAVARLDLAAGDVDDALAHAERAAEQSDEAELSYLVGQILLSQGRVSEAEKRLREALRKDPGHASAANDLAWVLAERGDSLDEALELAQRAVRIDRRSEFLDTLGWVQFKRGEAGPAVGTFEEALEVDPGASSVRYRLGLALESMGREQEARDALREALGAGAFPEADAARAELARLEADGQARP